MKRLVFIIILFSLLAVASEGHAQFGRTAGVLGIAPARLLADPTRARVYAALPSTNTVNVIDTTTLSVTASIQVGSSPAGMVVSPDGSRLYVACSGSTVSAVSVVSLDTLQALPAISLPFAAASVAAGLGGRVYVSSTDPVGGVYQVDTATGSVQGPFPGLYIQNLLLLISPDRRTLYVANGGGLSSFDVSTTLPVFLQRNIDTGDSTAGEFVLTPDGKHICATSSLGNDVSGGGTAFYDTADLNQSAGSFKPGNYNGPLAFSPDSAVAYQVQAEQAVLKEFDTGSFALLGSVPLPYPAGDGTIFPVADVAVDNTGSYVFVNEGAPVNEVVVFYTGRGSIQPTTAVPMLTVEAAETSIHHDQPGKFKLRRTGDTTQPLTAYYRVKGTATVGVDYAGLSGIATFSAGKATAKVKLIPRGSSTFPSVIVKLTLAPEQDYAVGTPAKAKIKITD